MYDNTNFSLKAANDKGMCDDTFVGKVKYNRESFLPITIETKKTTNEQGVTRRVSINYNNFNSSLRKIVVLLESPHVEEYLPNNISRPAWGKTGSRFNSQFIDAVNRSINNIISILNPRVNEEFNVYFVNSIRFQCSLGCDDFHRPTRDKVFLCLWNYLDFRQDCIDRLNVINPDLIINACTSKLMIKCLVSNFVMTDITLYSRYHLSAWDKNIKLKLKQNIMDEEAW